MLLQFCYITIANWVDNAAGVLLTNSSDKAFTHVMIKNSEWDLLQTLMTSELYEEIPGQVSSNVNVYFKLQRRSMTYVTNLIIPIILLAILGLLVYPLPPDSGEKISLGTTLFLAFSVFQLLIAEKLPSSTIDVPILSKYIGH